MPVHGCIGNPCIICHPPNTATPQSDERPIVDYLTPAPEREPLESLLDDAESLNGAIFDLADRFNVPVTNNEPRWQDGRYLWDIGDFITAVRAVMKRFPVDS